MGTMAYKELWLICWQIRKLVKNNNGWDRNKWYIGD